MEFMLILSTERDADFDPSVFPEMGKFAGELAARGRIRGGSPLHPEEEGARVRLRGGRPTVSEGPFTETSEIIAGYFLIDCKDRKEAIAIAKKCPHLKNGCVEVRQVVPMDGGEEDD